MLTILLCSGIKRSASTWSYNVCRLYADMITKSNGSISFSQYSNDTDKTIDLLKKEFLKRRSSGENANIVAVIKAHEIGPKTLSLVAQGKIHNIYTIRDPRDSLVSLEAFRPRTHTDRSFDDRIRSFQRWLIDGDSFFDDKCSLIIKYEDMHRDPIEQIKRIAIKLGVKCTEETYQKIHNATNEETTLKIIDELVKNNNTSNQAFCRTTQLHEKHLNGGHVGRWCQDLTASEQIKAEIAFYPWLVKFGYGVGNTPIRRGVHK